MPHKYVYVIGVKDTGPCKIGVAINVSRRIKALQPGNPYELRVFHAVRATYASTAYMIESGALAKLADCRLVGEWVGTSASKARDAIAAATKDLSVIVEQRTTIIGPRARPTKKEIKTARKVRSPEDTVRTYEWLTGMKVRK